MVVLLYLGRRYKDLLKPGDIFLTYLIIYPLGRFLLEFLRLDPPKLFGLNTNQTIMLIVGLSSALILFMRHRKPSKPQPEQANEADQVELR